MRNEIMYHYLLPGAVCQNSSHQVGIHAHAYTRLLLTISTCGMPPSLAVDSQLASGMVPSIAPEWTQFSGELHVRVCIYCIRMNAVQL